jgi:hypothetical protein
MVGGKRGPTRAVRGADEGSRRVIGIRRGCTIAAAGRGVERHVEVSTGTQPPQAVRRCRVGSSALPTPPRPATSRPVDRGRCWQRADSRKCRPPPHHGASTGPCDSTATRTRRRPAWRRSRRTRIEALVAVGRCEGAAPVVVASGLGSGQSARLIAVSGGRAHPANTRATGSDADTDRESDQPHLPAARTGPGVAPWIRRPGLPRLRAVLCRSGWIARRP